MNKVRSDPQTERTEDRFPNGPFIDLKKKGDCHLFRLPLEKGDSPLFVPFLFVNSYPDLGLQSAGDCIGVADVLENCHNRACHIITVFFHP